MKKVNVQVSLLESMLAISQSERLLKQHHLDIEKYQGMTYHMLIMELYTDVPELSQREDSKGSKNYYHQPSYVVFVISNL